VLCELGSKENGSAGLGEFERVVSLPSKGEGV